MLGQERPLVIVTLVISAVLALITSPLSKLLGRWVFAIPALGSGVGFVYFASLAPRVWAGETIYESVPWIPSMGVQLGFHLGALQLVLAMVVTGVGAMILAYSVWYFESARLKARTVGLLTAFAASMLALVLADDLIVLVIAWELTSVTSYLLVGLNHASRRNRSAAHTALIVTTVGGLAMLVGAIALGAEAGTYSLQQILADPPSTLITAVSVMLLLLGALTKSAIFPFHFWLPGAMAAPTPVSAFLHAAAMVKAGIYLAAMLAPAFVDVPGFRPTLILLGVATMLIGAWRALSQTDIKVLLAHGTVSQLGLLMTVVGIGTKAALLGGLALLASHAMFKAALFMVVGIVDKQFGTRRLTELGRVGRDRPVLAGAAILAALAMAGLPPTLAFTAKEVGLGAAWESIGLAGIPDVLAIVAFVGIIVGTAGTVAYTLRFLIGTFVVDRSPSEPREDAHVIQHGFWAQAVAVFPLLLALAGVIGGFFGDAVTHALTGVFATMPAGEPAYLALWHGVDPALIGAIVAVLGGVAVWLLLGRTIVEPTEPRYSAAAVYAWLMRALDRFAVEVTGRTQSGSLPVHITTILVTTVVLAGGSTAFMAFAMPDFVYADTIGQAVVAVAVSVLAIIAANTRGRLKTFLLMGAVGYGTALLFLLHGAPDLALTQVLVETVMLVLLVLVLRHLPKYFTNRPLRSLRWFRGLVAGLVGLIAAVVTTVAIAARSERPISDRFYEMAYEFGYGRNIVNVTLVDIRAWDTMGEISVLLAAATGVASLIFIRTRVVDPTGTLRGNRGRPRSEGTLNAGTWLRSGFNTDMHRRAPMLEMMTRLLFPVMIVVSVYLLFAGHNSPGGGFIAGLVAGLALCIRYLAGGAYELADAAPIDAGKLLGGGISLSAISLIGPVFFGGSIGQSYDMFIEIWGMGEIHLVTTTLFDIGVYLVVLGTVLDFIRSLGSGIDEQWRNDETPLPSAHSDRTLPMTENRRHEEAGR